MTTAIETSYAGCRFRSRLEARWAYFFDCVGLAWNYEIQGYEIPKLEGGYSRYLPDFWLPDLEIWVEVKGVLDAAALRDLILAASPAGLPDYPDGPTGSATGSKYGLRILLLGDLPREFPWLHTCLAFNQKDDLVSADGRMITHFRSGAWKLVGAYDDEPLNQWLVEDPPPEVLRRLVSGSKHMPRSNYSKIADAYESARSARFEYGEEPKPPDPLSAAALSTREESR